MIMKRYLTGTLLVLAAMVAIVVALSAAAAGTTPFLPGITVKDENPNGCVDCHRNAGAGKDSRLNVSLPANVKGHPDIAKVMKSLPADCAMCHAAGRTAAPLQQVIHQAHYRDPAKNAFVTANQGACLHCHTLSTEGVAGVKAAAKNW
jgi:hypothetical protein